jgi:hypothetical protein
MERQNTRNIQVFKRKGFEAKKGIGPKGFFQRKKFGGKKPGGK